MLIFCHPPILLSSPCTQRDITGWGQFSAAQVMNMSQTGQRGWGWLPPSRITTVYRMWRCTKWIWRLVHVVARPSKPPTGHLMDPYALGKEKFDLFRHYRDYNRSFRHSNTCC